MLNVLDTDQYLVVNLCTKPYFLFPIEMRTSADDSRLPSMPLELPASPTLAQSPISILKGASKTTSRDEIACCYRRLHKSRPEGKQSGPHYVSLRSGYRSRTSPPPLQHTNHRNHYIVGSRFRRLNKKGGEILLLGLCVCPQSLGNLGKRRSSFCTNYMHSCSNVNCKLTNSTCAFKGRPLVRM